MTGIRNSEYLRFLAENSCLIPSFEGLFNKMPTHSALEISGTASSTSKRGGDGESTTSKSYEYTLLILGDCAPTFTAGNNVAVHEVAVEFDSPIQQVSCGSGWSCLLCEDGRAYSFGDNTYGQLGQSHDRPHVRVPTPMSSPFCLLPRRRIIRLSCGSSHGGFVLDTGELFMFGCGSYGRLGTGSEKDTSVPARVQMKWTTLLAAAPSASNNRKQQSNTVLTEEEDEVRFTDVSCGDRHTLALVMQIQGGLTGSRRSAAKAKTSIVSFGDGMNGRLGLGDENDRHEGALLTTWLATSNVPGSGITGTNGYMTPPTIIAICAGVNHNLALSSMGGVFSWGNGVDGQLGHGIGESEWVPRQITFFKNLAVTTIRCGTSHSVAVSRTGVVYAWGRGAEGQLGVDLETNVAEDSIGKCACSPQSVGILKSSTQRVVVRTMAAKQNVTLAIDDRDRMFVWGDNELEQLGLPTSVKSETAVKSFIPKPKLLTYMDIHAPKAGNTNSQTLSRVMSLRELVATTKPEPIRLGLAHIDAGDRFTLLVFKTKPGIGSAGGNAQEGTSVSSGVFKETKESTPAVSTWNFSLTEELPRSAIPSKEAVYFQFMHNYKVYGRPIPPPVARGDDSDDYNDEDNCSSPTRSTNTRHRRSSVEQKAPGSSGSEKRDCSPNSSEIDDCFTNKTSPAFVRGFDTWLSKRFASPPKSSITPWIASSPAKRKETSNATSSRTTAIAHSEKSEHFPCQPTRPKSKFGPTLAIRQRNSSSKPPDSIATPATSTVISNQDILPTQGPTRHSLFGSLV